MPDFDISLVEYGHVSGHPAALFVEGAGDAVREVPFCFAVARSSAAVVLVDVGFSSTFHQQRLGRKYSDARWCSPVQAIARLGLAPADVDTVILTHKHFDHAQALPDFPAAEVFLQRREYDQHRFALAHPDEQAALLRATDDGLLDALDDRRKSGRLRLLDGACTVVPGLTVFPAHDTHTPGSQYVVVESAGVPWVLAGDNVSVYENSEGADGRGRLTPITSLTGARHSWRLAVARMVEQAGGDTRRVVPFHDDAVWDRFPTTTHDDGLHTATLTDDAGLTPRPDADLLHEGRP